MIEIEKRFNVKLDDNEISGIAMNFVNSGEQIKEHYALSEIEINKDKIIQTFSLIIENNFSIKINRENFNYIRFSTHVNHLLKRIDNQENIGSNNDSLYDNAVASFPLVSKCVDQIENYLSQNYRCILNNEEKLYLIMHVNRICANEGCN